MIWTRVGWDWLGQQENDRGRIEASDTAAGDYEQRDIALASEADMGCRKRLICATIERLRRRAGGEVRTVICCMSTRVSVRKKKSSRGRPHALRRIV